MLNASAAAVCVLKKVTTSETSILQVYRDHDNKASPEGYLHRVVNIPQHWGMTKPPIAVIVRERRKASGLTEHQFADASGVSQSNLNAIENGKKEAAQLRADTLLKLADYLKLHPRFLVTGQGAQQWTAPGTEQEERLLTAFSQLDPEERAEVVGRVLGMLDAKGRKP